MSIGYFEISNKKSTDFGLYIDSQVSFQSPSVKGEYIDIEGNDGALFLTEGKLNNAVLTFPVILEELDQSNLIEQSNDISNWLKSKIGWNQLFFSGDPEYVYSVNLSPEHVFNLNVGESGNGEFNFVIKPYKFLKSGLSESVLKGSIANPTQRQARPKLTVKGSGNITITIGSSVWKLRDVDGGVVIDSLFDNVTSLDGQRPAWDKITTYPLPKINPGQNAVTITGSVTEIKIIPRWEVIVG